MELVYKQSERFYFRQQLLMCQLVVQTAKCITLLVRKKGQSTTEKPKFIISATTEISEILLRASTGVTAAPGMSSISHGFCNGLGGKESNQKARGWPETSPSRQRQIAAEQQHVTSVTTSQNL